MINFTTADSTCLASPYSVRHSPCKLLHDVAPEKISHFCFCPSPRFASSLDCCARTACRNRPNPCDMALVQGGWPRICQASEAVVLRQTIMTGLLTLLVLGQTCSCHPPSAIRMEHLVRHQRDGLSFFDGLHLPPAFQLI